MMFVCHYVIIPFHPQYLPRHALQGAGCQGAGCRGAKRLSFLYLGQMLHSVGLYQHAKIQKKFIVAFPKKCPNNQFLTLHPLLIKGLFFRKRTSRPDVVQCWPLSSFKKSNKFIVAFLTKCQKRDFLTLKPC